MDKPKPKKKCSYLDFCYIAEAANCFGYRLDCPLYLATNERPVGESAFHKAMNDLIDKTKLKLQNR